MINLKLFFLFVCLIICDSLIEHHKTIIKSKIKQIKTPYIFILDKGIYNLYLNLDSILDDYVYDLIIYNNLYIMLYLKCPKYETLYYFGNDKLNNTKSNYKIENIYLNNNTSFYLLINSDIPSINDLFNLKLSDVKITKTFLDSKNLISLNDNLFKKNRIAITTSYNIGISLNVLTLYYIPIYLCVYQLPINKTSTKRYLLNEDANINPVYIGNMNIITITKYYEIKNIFLKKDTYIVLCTDETTINIKPIINSNSFIIIIQSSYYK